MSDDKWDTIFSNPDDGKPSAHIERIVEAILDGDKRQAIELIIERWPRGLVSYQHQVARHAATSAGRKVQA